jgi:sugar-specific transcriptional regulator TrmB
MIRAAKKTIYLSIWKQEFEHLQKDITAAGKRGIKIIINSFTDLPEISRAELFCYHLEETKLEKFWAHKIILIADKAELLMGEADRLQKKKTVWTSNRAMIDIALNHIILDITIYGIRINEDVSETVSSMQNGETDELGQLLMKKYPDIKF